MVNGGHFDDIYEQDEGKILSDHDDQNIVRNK